jgi:hypothetical protein
MNDQLGLSWVASMKRSADDHTPPDIAERLRFGRERALAKALACQPTRAYTTRLKTEQGWNWIEQAATALGGPYLNNPDEIDSSKSNWWFKCASFIPLIALIFGLIMMDDFLAKADIVTAAEIDTALLSDDLSPDVYSNAEFAEFLRLQAP